MFRACGGQAGYVKGPCRDGAPQEIIAMSVVEKPRIFKLEISKNVFTGFMPSDFKPSTFVKSLQGPRGYPDPQNDRFPIRKQWGAKFLTLSRGFWGGRGPLGGPGVLSLEWRT